MSCSNIKSLKVTGTDLDPDSNPNIQEMFKRLTELEIDEQSNWGKILPMCSNLETLSIQYLIENAPLNLNYKFLKLKIFKFDIFTRMWQNANKKLMLLNHFETLQRFMNCHTSLVKLSLRSPEPIEIKLKLDVIGLLEDLEELNMDLMAPEGSFEPLYNLSKLRKIQIRSSNRFYQISAKCSSCRHNGKSDN